MENTAISLIHEEIEKCSLRIDELELQIIQAEVEGHDAKALSLRGLQTALIYDRVELRKHLGQQDVKPLGVEIEKAVMSAFEKFEAKKEGSTIAFSTVSKSKVRSYLNSINIAVLEGEPLFPVENSLVSFQPFQWLDAEEKDTPRAISHLERELKKFGVTFGRSNYKMYDVHNDHSLLTFKDDKTGSLSGGTDLIIAPFGLAMESVIFYSCVAFEFKTKKWWTKKAWRVLSAKPLWS
mmetsp:Transcript_27233/g.38732  ORF Transcript_27233/g.38732 Transcript_27233/m.38732 type:complete len:237 (+) Transcript_27233:37-747(+)